MGVDQTRSKDKKTVAIHLLLPKVIVKSIGSHMSKVNACKVRVDVDPPHLISQIVAKTFDCSDRGSIETTVGEMT
jgi:hypothetical protein